jgi:hypothetical protein
MADRKTPYVIPPIVGTPEYRAFLDQLREAGGWPNDSAMVEAALAREARRLKIEAPPRTQPIGTNRFTTRKGDAK